MENGTDYLEQPIVPNDISLLAIPTTAGSGSEATRFAVIYRDGEKQSVSHPSALPSAVLLDPSALKTLPDYQRKSTMLDALCHGLESCWSVHATPESQEFACQAIQTILENAPAYLENDDAGNRKMLEAAHLAGKAINMTQTTAGHAMCYKLTTRYGLAHGHAAALCVAKLWPYMAQGNGPYVLPNGKERLETAFQKIAEAMKCSSVWDAIHAYEMLLAGLKLSIPNPKEEDYKILSKSVNLERLKNNPVVLDEAALNGLYHQILQPK
jgi:alcohol dehydrogenase class IV